MWKSAVFYFKNLFSGIRYGLMGTPICVDMMSDYYSG